MPLPRVLSTLSAATSSSSELLAEYGRYHYLCEQWFAKVNTYRAQGAPADPHERATWQFHHTMWDDLYCAGERTRRYLWAQHILACRREWAEEKAAWGKTGAESGG